MLSPGNTHRDHERRPGVIKSSNPTMALLVTEGSATRGFCAISSTYAAENGGGKPHHEIHVLLLRPTLGNPVSGNFAVVHHFQMRDQYLSRWRRSITRLPGSWLGGKV